MNDAKTTCCYCEKVVYVRGQQAHQERCFFGPVGVRVKAFMHAQAAGGVAMPEKAYYASSERSAQRLPGQTAIDMTFGTWLNFVEWCGLRYVRQYHKNGRREGLILAKIDAEIARARQAEKDAFDWSAMPVLRVTTKRVYNWRTRRDELCEVQELR